MIPGVRPWKFAARFLSAHHDEARGDSATAKNSLVLGAAHTTPFHFAIPSTPIKGNY